MLLDLTDFILRSTWMLPCFDLTCASFATNSNLVSVTLYLLCSVLPSLVFNFVSMMVWLWDACDDMYLGTLVSLWCALVEVLEVIRGSVDVLFVDVVRLTDVHVCAIHVLHRLDGCVWPYWMYINSYAYMYYDAVTGGQYEASLTRPAPHICLCFFEISFLCETHQLGLHGTLCTKHCVCNHVQVNK